MQSATRETLQVYAARMGRSWSDVKREFQALSETKRGALLAEMRAVEKQFVVYEAEQKAKVERRRKRWGRMYVVATWIAGLWARSSWRTRKVRAET